MVVSIIGGPQYRPLNTIVLIMGTPKPHHVYALTACSTPTARFDFFFDCRDKQIDGTRAGEQRIPVVSVLSERFHQFSNVVPHWDTSALTLNADSAVTSLKHLDAPGSVAIFWKTMT